MTTDQPLVEIDDLHVEFQSGGALVEAVSGVSFAIDRGETVAVVGESGSGKSVTALAVLDLLGNGRVSRGTITWDGHDITNASAKQMRRIRGREISVVFQDPMTALDPLFTIGSQVREALGSRMSRRDARARVVELLSQVGIPDPEAKIDAYPHQLSGGQRQRVMIASALAASPRLLIADEPTTALDVTVEAQVLALIRDLQRELGIALMLITHDMGVVAEMADRVIVFYAGEVVETGRVDEILTDPRHPYTRALLRAIPRPDTPRSEPMPTIPGVVPALDRMPAGCRFSTRCPLAGDEQCSEPQQLHVLGDRQVRCWRVTDDDAVASPTSVEVAR